MPSPIRKLRDRIQPPAPVFRLPHPRKPRFQCPICAYHGPFADFGHFEKHRAVFSHVDVLGPDDFPEIRQPLVHEGRARWPTADCPLRTPMPGTRHPNYVPVCHA